MGHSSIVAALLLAFTKGSVAYNCPSNVKVVSDIDVSKYAGIWYETASQNLPFLDGCSCSRYNFTMTGAQTFDDYFSCTKGGKSDGV